MSGDGRPRHMAVPGRRAASRARVPVPGDRAGRPWLRRDLDQRERRRHERLGRAQGEQDGANPAPGPRPAGRGERRWRERVRGAARGSDRLRASRPDRPLATRRTLRRDRTQPRAQPGPRRRRPRADQGDAPARTRVRAAQGAQEHGVCARASAVRQRRRQSRRSRLLRPHRQGAAHAGGRAPLPPPCQPQLLQRGARGRGRPQSPGVRASFQAPHQGRSNGLAGALCAGLLPGRARSRAAQAGPRTSMRPSHHAGMSSAGGCSPRSRSPPRTASWSSIRPGRPACAGPRREDASA